MWLWGIAAIDDPENVTHGIDIDSFIDHISHHNATIYFHNLKFDGHFIIDWLLKHDFFHVAGDVRDIAPEAFKTLISDMGKYFSITVKWANGHTTEFRDSLKKIPMSLSNVAKAFKLDEAKGKLDYERFRPVGHQPTDEELEYLELDVIIIAKAMREVLDSGMIGLTVASDSLKEFKRIFGAKNFEHRFPVFSDKLDAEIRRAYRGGFAYADPRFSKQITRSGLVLDVNSLYPSVMMNQVLPHGEPEYAEGMVTPTIARPLTIFSVTFTAKIKPDHIPCIQIKGSSMFSGTEYLTEIKEPTTLMVTNIDWALYQDHYDIDVLAYGGGWRFHATQGMFDGYINKWAAVKETAVGGKREIAKLHLNSLYGKFATNPNVTSKIPTLKNGAVHLVRGKDETRAPIYTAVGVFITSFARDLTIRAAQENYATFAYADTDSLHLLQDVVPDTIDVHPSRMGAWKLEYHFDAAFYIRPKAYLERIGEPVSGKHRPGEYVNAVAGLPTHISSELTFESVAAGAVIEGKLRPKSVPGGVVLEKTPFELKI